MNQPYSVPIIVNGVLEHRKVNHIPTTIDLGNRDYYELSPELCIVREAKRIMFNEGHDNFAIKVADIRPCR